MEFTPQSTQSPFPAVTGGEPSPAKSKFRLNKKVVAIAAVVLVVVALIFAGWTLFFAQDDTAAGANVTITDKSFIPNTVKIKKGQNVTWTNLDTAAHEVASDETSLKEFTSNESLEPGDVYIFPFEQPGTYSYYDPLNPAQYKGTVIVE
ncbi:MAG: cupredoxin domain-containing protein [Candidatus Saccharimonadales bacterium]